MTGAGRGTRALVKQLMACGVFVAMAGAAALVGMAQAPAPVVDTSKLGPPMGVVVPPLAGTDQFGRPQTLVSLSGPKGLMLVFSRSADW